MGRREQYTVGELTITKGIKSGNANKTLAKVLNFLLGTPAAIVANRYVTSTNMKNGAYTLANTSPGDGLAHSVTVAQTAVGAEDTNGIITVVGIDLEGRRIVEEITPEAGSTIEGVKAFAEITSITGSGWVINEGNDTLVIGFGEKIGLYHRLAATTDILMVGFNTAIENAPTVAVDARDLAKNVVTVSTGDGTKKIRILYQV